MDFSCILRWRKWIRFAVVVMYIILLVVAVPLCIWELERKGAPDHVQAWFVGGLFVLMALPISFWGILQHIINYTTPHLQRHIIRILWMVPIYALNAWFALRFPAAAIYLDTLRECYEAYVIYNFMAYLLSFLSNEYPHLDIQIEGKPPVKHIFPFCLLPPCRFSLKFVQHCKHGVLQYTVVRPAMTVLALICEGYDKYNEGDFDFTTAWSYIVIINNLSQILAMYCLVLFYKAFKEELKPLRPVPKFLCVKAVVFLSFWQAVIIAALAKLGAIPVNGSWIFYKDIKEVATGLQDFLICIEMFLAAIAHYFSFSHKPFVDVAVEQQQNCCISFLSMWNVKDITDDVVEHARYIGQGMKKTLSRGMKMVDEGKSERTPIFTGRDNRATGESVMIQLAVPNSQTTEVLPSSAVTVNNNTDSFDGERITGDCYVVPFNKPTPSSMISNAGFPLDASSQHEDLQVNTSSDSLKAYDSSGNKIDENNSNLQKKDGKHSKVITVAEISIDNKVNKPDHEDDIFKPLEMQQRNLDPGSVSSYSENARLFTDSQEDSSDDRLRFSEHIQDEDSAPRESTEIERSDSKMSQENATLAHQNVSSSDDPKIDIGGTSHKSDHSDPIV